MLDNGAKKIYEIYLHVDYPDSNGIDLIDFVQIGFPYNFPCMNYIHVDVKKITFK